jgi:23S rRNA (guanine745-N1)-methyltransferase
LPLERQRQILVCPTAHAYDIARSGYVNLLQPQDRRSRDAGDSKQAVDARARLLAAGIGRPLLEDLVQRSVALALAARPTVVDLGSGSGDLLASLSAVQPIAGIGIDLSAAAADHAARRFPELLWVVANADRRLPLIDHSVQLVISSHGRRNPQECARVLAPNGRLLMAVPAEDDLVELRELIHGRKVERPRADSLIAAHDEAFALTDRSIVRGRRRLERDDLIDMLRTTYRGGRFSEAARVDTLSGLEITTATEIFLFAPR